MSCGMAWNMRAKCEYEIIDNTMYSWIWRYGARDLARQSDRIILCIARDFIFRASRCKYEHLVRMSRMQDVTARYLSEQLKNA